MQPVRPIAWQIINRKLQFMDLSKILTIAGKGGLFSVVSQTKNGLIVESLVDGKKTPIFASHQTSSLEDISIFTYGEDIPLKEVLWKIHEKEQGKPAPNPKSSAAELKAYFETVLPEYDKERVYVSDIKKVLSWYNLLLEKGLITPPQEETPEEQQPSAPENEKGEEPSETDASNS